jgi:lipopolysaccharide/colanic/teichoic acid biosynthesis glycosyltransferase
VIDLFFILLFFPILFPIFMITYLIVWIFEGQPVIYADKRLGEYRREFIQYKFRSMKAGEVGFTQDERLRELANKSPGNPRITPIGKFLRRSSIDELPQVFNILLGDMSLIGPRPAVDEMAKTYEPWQFERFSVPQGLTGWWQVNGRSENPLDKNTHFDIEYIHNYSIWLDLKIVFKTIGAVLSRRGAY